MSVLWFDESVTPEVVGGKGYRLSVMSKRGLPVPNGFCIPADCIKTISPAEIERELARISSRSVAVRSSAYEEDGRGYSFAGVYKTILNISGGNEVWNAVHEIYKSAYDAAAQAYRLHFGIAKPPEMSVVVQLMVQPDAAGVLFMQDPLDGSDRMIVEGSWGLGESVVAGEITPDRWTLSRDGKIISTQISNNKDTAAIPGKSGTEQIEVPEHHRRIPCLNGDTLDEIVKLARCCERLFDSPQDLEWAVAGGKVWILQSRPITGKRKL